MDLKAIYHIEWPLATVWQFEPPISKWWFSFPAERAVLRVLDGAQLWRPLESGAVPDREPMFVARKSRAKERRWLNIAQGQRWANNGGFEASRRSQEVPGDHPSDPSKSEETRLANGREWKEQSQANTSSVERHESEDKGNPCGEESSPTEERGDPGTTPIRSWQGRRSWRAQFGIDERP